MNYDQALYKQADEYWERYYDDEHEQTYVSYQCSDCGQGFESVHKSDEEGVCPHCGHDNWEKPLVKI